MAALFLAAACGSAGATSPSPEDAAKARSTLTIVALDPLTVKGTRFLPGERVKLLVSSGTAKAKAVRANGRGRFTATFAVEPERCTSIVVQAFGARGSRAMVDITAPHCAKPDADLGLPYERP